jgi:hypothetical protein
MALHLPDRQGPEQENHGYRGAQGRQKNITRYSVIVLCPLHNLFSSDLMEAIRPVSLRAFHPFAGKFNR